METLKDYMSPTVRISLGNQMTTHNNLIMITCQRDKNGRRIPFTGIARPGKTNRDRFRKENPKSKW